MSTEENNKLDLASLGSMSFTPDWAKKDAGISVGKVREDRHDDRPRKPFGEKKPFGDKKPFKRPFEKGASSRRNFGEVREKPRPLDAEVKILPETKALGTIIRKLQQDTHAYKLKDLAYFFLDNPESILLKVTTKETFHQCKACSFAALSEEEVVDHIVSSHLVDYYAAKEIEVEPPKGNFSCVAKCGLTGVFLGPPNIHEFGANVKEMIRTRFPNMSESEYRSHIEMVRDAESIEAWRQSAVKRTVYTLKGASEEATPLTREQAEIEFKRTILSSLLDKPKHLMITASAAMKSPVKPLVWAVKDAIEKERRAPYNMCFALRGAFHHRKMKFFRANDAKGPEFVINLELKPFDTEHAIPELAKVATFVAEHPCCDMNELAAEGDVKKHLDWLVSTGHVIAFTNGVYSAVEKYPKYGPQWKKRKTAKPNPTSTEEHKAEETKIAEEPKVEVQEEVKNEVTDQLAE